MKNIAIKKDNVGKKTLTLSNIINHFIKYIKKLILIVNKEKKKTSRKKTRGLSTL